MKVAVSSDEYHHLVEVILEELERRGHEAEYLGPTRDQKEKDWPVVTRQAVEQVEAGLSDEAIVLCWTGTGCSIVANKVRGIRAALCSDAETARGARIWNHANVLALSLRATSEAVLREILDKWFDTPPGDDDWNREQIRRVRAMDEARG